MKLKYVIIFDNAGGVTLQVETQYATTFLDPIEAAKTVKDLLKNNDISYWEGHEPEALELDPTDDEINNGGYDVFSDVNDIPRDSSSINIRQFIEELERD